MDAAYKIHSKLGPGLLESVYLAVLAYELRQRGLAVDTERALPVIYKAVRIDIGFRIDMIVEEKVIVELKIEPPLWLTPRRQARKASLWRFCAKILAALRLCASSPAS